MSEANLPPTCPHPQLRPITLIRSEGLWLASPAKGECSAARGFAPFPLPPVPRSLLDWLVVAGQRFWNRHHRCMAALLLVDCQGGGWTLRLPRQRCGPEFARWSAAAADHPDLPASMRLGGSFQTLAGDDAPQLAVPTVPGFHFTLAVTERHPLAAFVSRGREAIAVEPSSLLADDWGQTLHAALPRLHLA